MRFLIGNFTVLTLLLLVVTLSTYAKRQKFARLSRYTEMSLPTQVRIGESFELKLPSNPSTGYSWTIYDGKPNGERFLRLTQVLKNGTSFNRIQVVDADGEVVFTQGDDCCAPVLLNPSDNSTKLYRVSCTTSSEESAPAMVGSPKALSITLVAVERGHVYLRLINDRVWTIPSNVPVEQYLQRGRSRVVELEFT